jgi:glycosyltransferase involved in cell wall biosynthesis
VADARASGLDVVLRIIGPSTTPAEDQVRTRLLALIDELDLRDAVRLDSGVPRSEIPGAMRCCHALVSTTVDGSADKAVFEAMAVGRPVLASNPAIASLTEGWPIRLRFDTGSAGDLATVLRGVQAAGSGILTSIGRGLHERIVREHSLEHWACRVAQLAAGEH